MKFRHQNGVRLALTSGHVVLVNKDWQALDPMFHREALAQGCECDKNTIRTTTLSPPTGSDTAVTPLDEAASIREALIRMVERNDEADFTGAGAPNLKVLAKETGFKADKTQALAVWHALKAEAGGDGGLTDAPDAPATGDADSGTADSDAG